MDLVAVLSISGFELKNLTYLTPGLWERTGVDFWGGFLFETPFVVLRTFPYILFLPFTVLFGYWTYKAHQLYKKDIKDNENIYL